MEGIVGCPFKMSTSGCKKRRSALKRFMEKLSVYWHPNCSTCKNAVKFLKKHDVDHVLHDLREKAPSKKEIQTMMEKNYADTPKKLFNTSGQAYRTSGMKDRIDGLSAKEMQDALSKDGLLVKRPFVLLKNGDGLVGFNEDTWKKFFKDHA